MKLRMFCFVVILVVSVAPDEASRNSTICEENCVCYKKVKEGCSPLDIKLANMITIQDFEISALDTLDKNARDYYKSGANFENTLRDNIEAFKRYTLRPRVLRDVSNKKLCTTVLGSKISFPVGLSPVAFHRLASDGGELETARAAGSAGTIMTLSTLSTTRLEDVAREFPHSPKWFQLYVFKDRKLTEKLVRRAENAGYRALVVTVDTPFFGTRVADVRNKFKLPPNLQFANFDPGDLEQGNLESGGDSVLAAFSKILDASLTWENIKAFMKMTKLPVIVKGVLTGEDAKIAADIGCAAVWVSNHGGRQLDNVPATIDALPEIVDAVKGRGIEVYVDGGIRNGTDVFKALAIGARAVFYGRPNLWGLAVGGEKGARKVLELLRKEFDMALGLSGLDSVDAITPNYIVKKSYYEDHCPSSPSCKRQEHH